MNFAFLGTVTAMSAKAFLSTLPLGMAEAFRTLAPGDLALGLRISVALPSPGLAAASTGLADAGEADDAKVTLPTFLVLAGVASDRGGGGSLVWIAGPVVPRGGARH